MAGNTKKEKSFALVFATTICWARQSANGKRYKRLVYFGEKTDSEQENAHFFEKLEARLRGLGVIDEQHRLYREYSVLIRCERFRIRNDEIAETKSTDSDPIDADLASDIKKGKERTLGLSPGAAEPDKLSQCRMINLLKARYNVAQHEGTPWCGCLLSEKREEKKNPPLLYFDEVVRLLQIYTNMPPSRYVIDALEGQNLFTYARILIISEGEVMSLLTSLSLWIIPMDWYGDEGHELATGITEKDGEEHRVTVHENDKTHSRPQIVACKKNVNNDKASATLQKLPLYRVDDFSVRGICSKLKNDCIEHIVHSELF